MTDEKRKEYNRKYYQENKERLERRNKEWIENNKDRYYETMKKWREKNPESMAKAMKKFQESHDWVQYCNEKRRERVEKLKEQGCLNPWQVINKGRKARFDNEVSVKSYSKNGKAYFGLTVPVKISDKLNISKNDNFRAELKGNEIIFTRVEIEEEE